MQNFYTHPTTPTIIRAIEALGGVGGGCGNSGLAVEGRKAVRPLGGKRGIKDKKDELPNHFNKMPIDSLENKKEIL